MKTLNNLLIISTITILTASCTDTAEALITNDTKVSEDFTVVGTDRVDDYPDDDPDDDDKD